MVNTKLTSRFTNIHLFYEKRMHFQNLQDRHRLCIFNITLFAYDFLFEQHRNSHDECLMNRSTSNQGAWHDYCPSSGAVKSRFGESLRGHIAWGKSLPGSLGALDDQTKIFGWYDDTTLLTVAPPYILRAWT